MLKQRITGAEAQELIDSGKKVVIDFFADWCGPCQMFLPVFHAQGEAKEEIYITINIDDEQEFTMKNEVQGVPTIVVFEGGKEINRTAGFMTPEVFENFVNEK